MMPFYSAEDNRGSGTHEFNMCTRSGSVRHLPSSNHCRGPGSIGEGCIISGKEQQSPRSQCSVTAGHSGAPPQSSSSSSSLSHYSPTAPHSCGTVRSQGIQGMFNSYNSSEPPIRACLLVDEGGGSDASEPLDHHAYGGSPDYNGFQQGVLPTAFPQKWCRRQLAAQLPLKQHISRRLQSSERWDLTPPNTVRDIGGSTHSYNTSRELNKCAYPKCSNQLCSLSVEAYTSSNKSEAGRNGASSCSVTFNPYSSTASLGLRPQLLQPPGVPSYFKSNATSPPPLRPRYSPSPAAHHKPQSRSIFIGNIPAGVHMDSLLTMIQQKGSVSELVFDVRPRRWTTAYATYSKQSEAARAVRYFHNRSMFHIGTTAQPHRLVCCLATQPPASLCVELEATDSLSLKPFYPKYSVESSEEQDSVLCDPPVATGFSLLKDGPPGSNLFVYGIPSDWTEVTLMRLSQEFGHIVGIRIPTAMTSFDGRQLNKGFGFISYDSVESSTAAVTELGGRCFLGKPLSIQPKIGEQFEGPSIPASFMFPTAPPPGLLVPTHQLACFWEGSGHRSLSEGTEKRALRYSNKEECKRRSHDCADSTPENSTPVTQEDSINWVREVMSNNAQQSQTKYGSNFHDVDSELVKQSRCAPSDTTTEAIAGGSHWHPPHSLIFDDFLQAFQLFLRSRHVSDLAASLTPELNVAGTTSSTPLPAGEAAWSSQIDNPECKSNENQGRIEDEGSDQMKALSVPEDEGLSYTSSVSSWKSRGSKEASSQSGSSEPSSQLLPPSCDSSNPAYWYGDATPTTDTNTDEDLTKSSRSTRCNSESDSNKSSQDTSASSAVSQTSRRTGTEVMDNEWSSSNDDACKEKPTPSLASTTTSRKDKRGQRGVRGRRQRASTAAKAKDGDKLATLRKEANALMLSNLSDAHPPIADPDNQAQLSSDLAHAAAYFDNSLRSRSDASPDAEFCVRLAIDCLKCISGALSSEIPTEQRRGAGDIQPELPLPFPTSLHGSQQCLAKAAQAEEELNCQSILEVDNGSHVMAPNISPQQLITLLGEGVGSVGTARERLESSLSVFDKTREWISPQGVDISSLEAYSEKIGNGTSLRELAQNPGTSFHQDWGLWQRQRLGRAKEDFPPQESKTSPNHLMGESFHRIYPQNSNSSSNSACCETNPCLDLYSLPILSAFSQPLEQQQQQLSQRSPPPFSPPPATLSTPLRSIPFYQL